jgi:hypothetical protein
MKWQQDRVNSKAYRALWTCRFTFRRTCGLRPTVMRWIYTIVVRLMVIYTAAVWWPRIKFRRNRAELGILQRMVYLDITGVMGQLQWLQFRSSLDSFHCACSWRPRPGQEFIDTSAVINGNPNLRFRTYIIQSMQKGTDKMIPRHVYNPS